MRDAQHAFALPMKKMDSNQSARDSATIRDILQAPPVNQTQAPATQVRPATPGPYREAVVDEGGEEQPAQGDNRHPPTDGDQHDDSSDDEEPHPPPQPSDEPTADASRKYLFRT